MHPVGEPPRQSSKSARHRSANSLTNSQSESATVCGAHGEGAEEDKVHAPRPRNTGTQRGCGRQRVVHDASAGGGYGQSGGLMTVLEVLAPAGVLLQSADVSERGHPDRELPTVPSWQSFVDVPDSGYCGSDDENADLLELDLDDAQDWLLDESEDFAAMAGNASELSSLLKDAEDLVRATNAGHSGHSGLLGMNGAMGSHPGLAPSLTQAVLCSPSGTTQAVPVVGTDERLKVDLKINKRKAVEELMKEDEGNDKLDVMRPFHCSFSGCTYKASKPRYLREHERVHTGERPYKCPWVGCTYAAAGQGHISRHIRTHTGVKPYQCKEPGCGYATSQSGHLRTHMRTHSGERPFKCSITGCNYAAGRRGHLLRHMKIHGATSDMIDMAEMR